MSNRERLHQELCDILGSSSVYFQPPESIKIKYPAIVYSRQRIENTFANDAIYSQKKAYKVTVIDKDPDSVIVDKISLLNMCRHDSHFVVDNLNHDIFTLYY